MKARNVVSVWMGRHFRRAVFPAVLLILLVTMALVPSAPALAAADTYRPNSDVSISSYISGNGGGTHSARVSDLNDATYVWTTNKDWHYDRYGLPDHSSALNGITTINSVTLWARV